MRLDSISAIAEIAPFYGYLDDVYRLMRRGNRKMHKMWDGIWVKLSEDAMRKTIYIDYKNKAEVVDIPIKCPLYFTLYNTYPIHITNEEQYEWIIELFENFENPKMIETYYAFNRNKDWDTRVTLLNYRKYMKMVDFSYIDLYNKIVDIAIEKEFKQYWIATFAFIHEIQGLNNIKFIKTILFPWNEENEAEKMIEIWKEFTESKTFEYNDVKLIWDGMDIKNFIKIYIALANQNIKLQIVVKKNFQNLSHFLNEVGCIKSNKTSIKMSNSDDFILWDLQRLNSQITIKKWYSRQFSSDCIIKFSDITMKIMNQNVINRLTRVSINSDNLLCLKFNLIKCDDEKLLFK